MAKLVVEPLEADLFEPVSFKTVHGRIIVDARCKGTGGCVQIHVDGDGFLSPTEARELVKAIKSATSYLESPRIERVIRDSPVGGDRYMYRCTVCRATVPADRPFVSDPKTDADWHNYGCPLQRRHRARQEEVKKVAAVDILESLREYMRSTMGRKP